jgi:hypothetical protein
MYDIWLTGFAAHILVAFHSELKRLAYHLLFLTGSIMTQRAQKGAIMFQNQLILSFEIHDGGSIHYC